MPEYLSDEWLAAARQALEAATFDPPIDAPLAVSQVVSEGPHGVVAYTITIDGATATLRRDGQGTDPHTADLRFSQTYATAAAIARGDESAQWAFMHGRLQVGGDIGRMIAAIAVIETLGDALAELRERTTY